ncbi:DUF6124 family protein [Pseudomonas quasicaspiana]|uniref:DUF6124 family protein n=1 Tax=Pseudomonas quasicaspiana TaxID=2829821 RepID=UPI001E28ED78|nr:DUF3077 domain-containing protein [Pseudomonas quasicaspiana]MCD5971526.1 DUF3077 domain-containing protein [Pseudomonas quasicaspiana]
MTNHRSLEQLLNDSDELLRCAKATAYESADSLSGSQRDHAFSVVHLIEMARCKMEDAVKFSDSAPHPRDAA